MYGIGDMDVRYALLMGVEQGYGCLLCTITASVPFAHSMYLEGELSR
jgi:hypothetical protein